MWLSLLACVPEDMPEVDDGTAFLGDVSDIPERTRLASYGTARLTEDGEELSEPTFSAPWSAEPLVVVEVGDRVRVHWTEREVELLLWLDRPDLVDVLHSRAWSRGTSDETGAEFPAGLAVTWEEGRPIAEDGGLHLHARGPVGNAAVDQVYIPTEGPAAPEPDGYLRSGIDILDVPGGDPIAETVDHGDGFLVPARRIRESGGWTLIDAVEDTLRVRGWVPAADVGEQANMGVGGCSCGGFSRCGGFGVWGGPSVILPVGTLLRDGVAGPIVGRVVEPLTVSGQLTDGRITFHRYTPWGTAALTASPAENLWQDADTAAE